LYNGLPNIVQLEHGGAGNMLISLAIPAGLEPATLCLEDRALRILNYGESSNRANAFRKIAVKTTVLQVVATYFPVFPSLPEISLRCS
jgi:hypothetical protein